MICIIWYSLQVVLGLFCNNCTLANNFDCSSYDFNEFHTYLKKKNQLWIQCHVLMETFYMKSNSRNMRKSNIIYVARGSNLADFVIGEFAGTASLANRQAV